MQSWLLVNPKLQTKSRTRWLNKWAAVFSCSNSERKVREEDWGKRFSGTGGASLTLYIPSWFILTLVLQQVWCKGCKWGDMWWALLPWDMERTMPNICIYISWVSVTSCWSVTLEAASSQFIQQWPLQSGHILVLFVHRNHSCVLC